MVSVDCLHPRVSEPELLDGEDGGWTEDFIPSHNCQCPESNGRKSETGRALPTSTERRSVKTGNQVVETLKGEDHKNQRFVS